jgi:hypothetical protein
VVKRSARKKNPAGRTRVKSHSDALAILAPYE